MPTLGQLVYCVTPGSREGTGKAGRAWGRARGLGAPGDQAGGQPRGRQEAARPAPRGLRVGQGEHLR